MSKGEKERLNSLAVTWAENRAGKRRALIAWTDIHDAYTSAWRARTEDLHARATELAAEYCTKTIHDGCDHCLCPHLKEFARKLLGE